MTSPPREVRIRDYEEDDAPRLAQIFYEAVHALGLRRYTPEQVAVWAPEPRDPGKVHALATDGRTTLVAVDASGRAVGYADLERSGHIDQLYVHPDVVGLGVAESLLDELVARAAADGAPRLYAEASELARGLFERKGFAVLRRRDFELRGVMIHNYAMERTLS